jgi:tRNA-dihydrouridine synthase B
MVKFAHQISKDATDTASCDGGSRFGGFGIGDLMLDGAAFLAPMAGVTDLAMRRLARNFGAALAFSEMVASDELANGGRESFLRAQGGGISPHAVQIAGCEAKSMAEAARLAQDSGADLIDINMGCPAKRVVGGAAGSALMRDLDHAARLIAAVTQAVTIPVSVKMRLGWDENSLNAPELARRAEAEGARMIVVHGRTRQQFYKGAADWAAIRPVSAAVNIPVVANGDCQSPQDARKMLENSGVQAVMIGRAALGQPWLVGDIAYCLSKGYERPAPSPRARRDAALEHYAGLLAIYGPAQGLRHARKHLAAYADIAEQAGGGLDEASRKALVRSEAPDEVFDLLGRLYATAPEAEAA